MSTTISEARAIELAIREAISHKNPIGTVAPVAIRKERHMRLDRNTSGWLVIFQLDVPPGFEPDLLMVEVYDDGRLFIPVHL